MTGGGRNQSSALPNVRCTCVVLTRRSETRTGRRRSNFFDCARCSTLGELSTCASTRYSEGPTRRLTWTSSAPKTIQPRRTRRGFAMSGHQMTHDPTRCLRPGCRFAPLPAMTESGGLEVFAYCSPACKDWTESALTVARREHSPTVERQAERLDVLARLLDLREHPSEYDAANGGV